MAGGCSDDSGSDCGNGKVEGSENCDTAELGGATCQTIKGNFTGGALACTAACTFDTSGCTSAPETCNNGVLDPGEDCDGTELDGMTCATVAGDFNSGTLGCTAGCKYDTALCETSAVGPWDLVQAVIAAADSDALELPLEGVTVTYLKPLVGEDPAGFFVQAQGPDGGPALFVAVDPQTLTPAPAVNDVVSLTVTAKQTNGSLAYVTAIKDLSKTADGDAAAMAQDLSSAADIVSALDSYAAELITVSGTIAEEIKGAGQGHLAAVVTTAGITGDTNLRLRITEELNSKLGLDVGCGFTVTATPLWRYNAAAQISAWAEADISVTGCPAPKVVEAVAVSATSVDITFNRAIDGASVTADGSQFTFDSLTASAAVAADNKVTVTTSAQDPGAPYNVTVAATVTDTNGTGVDATANAAAFFGFGTASSELACDDRMDNDEDGYADCLDVECAAEAHCLWEAKLYLWELDCDQVSTDSAEFVELWNNTGAAIDFEAAGSKYFLLFINGSTDLSYMSEQLTGTLDAGEVYLVGNAAVSGVAVTISGSSIQNGPDGVLLVQCNDCTDASADFPKDTNVGTADTFTSGGGATATKIDALAYDTDDSDAPSLMSALGVTEQFNEDGNSTATVPNKKDTDSLQRVAPDSWMPGTPTPGVAQKE